MSVEDEWARIAVELAKNHSPDVVRLVRKAYYAGAIAVNATLLKAVTSGVPGALEEMLKIIDHELVAYLNERGEFE